MKYLIPATILVVLGRCHSAYADSTQEYCDYAKEKARAESILSQAPQLVIGGGRDGSNNAAVLGFAVKESLSGFLKGISTATVGQDDCQLYRLTNELQRHVDYDLTNFQLKQNQFRQDAISIGIKYTSSLIAAETLRVNAGTSTKVTLSSLQAYRAKLEDELANLKQQEAFIRVPVGTQTTVPLIDTIGSLEAQSLKYQKDLSKQAKYDNWDVSVTTGVGTNPNDSMFSTPRKGFTNLQFTYSFGGPARSRALDAAANHYNQWTITNDQGPVRLAYQIREQVQNAVNAAKGSQASYGRYHEAIQSNLDSLEGLDTAPAHSFRIQLQIEQVSNDIEAACNDYSVTQFTSYLSRNFQKVM